MFYRFLFALSLLAFPLTSAQAAYQQQYLLSPSSSSASSMSTPLSDAGVQDQHEDTSDQKSEMSTPMIHGLEDGNYVSGEWVILENSAEEITRGHFTAELVRSMYTQAQIDSCFASISPSKSADFALVFTDVSVEHLYAKEICIAMRDGIVRGYNDGSFAPDRMVTFTESAKILSRAYALAPFADIDTKGPWYTEYVRALVVRNVVPVSITKMSHIVTYGEAIEMLDRLQNNVTWRPAQQEKVLFAPTIRRGNQVPNEQTSSTSSVSSDASSSTVRVRHPLVKPSSASSASTSSKESFWDLF